MHAFIVAMFGMGHIELFFILLLPPILVLISPRVGGSKKIGWFLIALFLSWLGYGLFLVLASEKNQ